MPCIRPFLTALFFLAVSIGNAAPMPTLPEKDGTAVRDGV
jgi:hypothetical protein